MTPNPHSSHPFPHSKTSRIIVELNRNSSIRAIYSDCDAEVEFLRVVDAAGHHRNHDPVHVRKLEWDIQNMTKLYPKD